MKLLKTEIHEPVLWEQWMVRVVGEGVVLWVDNAV